MSLSSIWWQTMDDAAKVIGCSSPRRHPGLAVVLGEDLGTVALTLRHDADVEPRVEELARGELAKAVEGQVERCGLAHPSEAAIDLVGGHAASRDMSEDGGDPQLCRPGVTRPSAQLFPWSSR